jgi:hypothetical protein
VVAVCSDGPWLIEYTDRSKHVKISWTISGQIGKDPCAGVFQCSPSSGFLPHTQMGTSRNSSPC